MLRTFEAADLQPEASPNFPQSSGHSRIMGYVLANTAQYFYGHCASTMFGIYFRLFS